MVFNVSGAVDSNKSDFIEGSDVEFGITKSEKHDGDIPRPYYARRWKRNRCCVILPWFLFAVCFLMLGFSMCWGWNQHRQVLKLMGGNHDKNYPDTDDIPKPSYFDDKRIPYGNDGLFANDGSNAQSDENDDVLIQEDVIQLFNGNNQPLLRDPIFNPNQPSDDVNSFGVITVSLPSFENFGDLISSFLGNFQMDDPGVNSQTNGTDVSPV